VVRSRLLDDQIPFFLLFCALRLLLRSGCRHLLLLQSVGAFAISSFAFVMLPGSTVSTNGMPVSDGL
jgi:hypothetical protein